MITVRTPDNLLFNYAECEELYNNYKEQLEDDEFEDVVARTRFYAFYIARTLELIGCLYFYKKGRKLFINGFANRHHHLLNVECLKEATKWFKRNIYAKANNRMSALILLRSGFKKEKDLYIHRR